ncbi:unnamed protein product [Trypanosoma congolense IL3000]|uniref:WGS project CAEQ00000000 data, annotated contig 1719 n=1 Tax=Trypanosoma congolense (strain IL3000) TaxID=1068625 RepID=F9W8A2_TRYCI|nr:unnamed protein product [Trypanosoma congolense IL3000]
MKIGKRTGDVPLGPELDALLQSVPNERRCDTLRGLWRAMGGSRDEIPEKLTGLPQEEWVRMSCRILFYLWLPQWAAEDFVEGRWVGTEAQQRNEAMETFLRYAEENLLVRVTRCVIEEVSDVLEGRRNRENRGNEALQYRRKSTTDDLILLMESLDGLEEKYLNTGSGLIPLVEWVARAQRAKLEQLFDTWVEPLLIQQQATEENMSTLRSALKQQLLHWMMELDEPDYVRFWDFMRSLNSKHFRGMESESPLQTLLDVNHYILSAKDKLDFVVKYEPEKWTEELRKREEEYKDFCKHGRTHEWTWDELREKHFCDEHTLKLAEDLEGLLKTELPAGALSNFKKQYQRHQACHGDKIKVEQQEKNVLKSDEELKKVLRVICGALKSVKGYSLRRTQLVAIVTLVRGCTVLNVETGEGKTAIAGCCAAFKAYCGYRVDAVTSSETLAKQLHDELGNFLEKLFGEDMCHVLSGDCSEGFGKPVVFGTFKQFISSDLAYTNCGAKSNADLEKRKSSLRYLLVDEADQPLLNDFAHVVYLNSPWLPGRRVTPGLVSLMEKVHAQEDDTDSLKQAYRSGVGAVCKTDKDEAMSELRLSRYVKSARLASRGLREGVDYLAAEGVIGVPYNADTGELQRGMTWQDGLSTFVSLKNGGLWDDEGLAPVFCAYFTFLASYRGAMGGMTGTVGCWRSRRVLEEVYGLRVKSIPRAFRRRFSLEKPVALKTENQRDDAMISEAVRRAEGGQPVLVLMQYPSEAKVVLKKLQERVDGMDPNNQPEVVLYLDDGEQHETPDIEKPTRNIIVVSTALAGRGKDFKLNNEQKERGGLFVILGYGATQREMTQAYGRAARQTDRGGAVSMVFHTSGDYYQALNEATFGEKLRLQTIQSEDARKMDLEKHLRDVYLKIVKTIVDDNKEFAHKLKQCDGLALCQCLRYNNPADPRNCRKLANFLSKVMETRFGRWMNEHRDDISKASRSVKDSAALLEKMRREVLDKLQRLAWEEKPHILNFCRTSDEALEFCLSVCRVEALSELWEKPESKLQSFGSTCTFGTIPYYVGYSYLKRAEKNEIVRRDFFEKAAACFGDAADSLGRWAWVYEHVNEVADRIHPGPGRREAFTDRCEIMNQHHRIASCLAGTRNWNPMMFAAAFHGNEKSPINAKKSFGLLLKKGILTPAQLKLGNEAELKKKLQNMGLVSATGERISDEDLSSLAGALIGARNSEYGLGLYDALEKEAQRDQLWSKLTDPKHGVIQPFGVNEKIRHGSDENLTKKIEDALTELDPEFTPLATSVFMNTIGVLRTEQFPHFEVKMGRLTDAFKAYGIDVAACASQQVEYFRPLGQHVAVVLTREATWGEWVKNLFTTWKGWKTLVSFAVQVFCRAWAAIVNLGVKLVDFCKKAYEAASRLSQLGWENLSWERLQKICGPAALSLAAVCMQWGGERARNLAQVVRDTVTQTASRIKAAMEGGLVKYAKVVKFVLDYAMGYKSNVKGNSVLQYVLGDVSGALLKAALEFAHSSVRAGDSSGILQLCKNSVGELLAAFQKNFLDRLRPALYQLHCDDRPKFEEFKRCLALKFNELRKSNAEMFSHLLHDVLSFCQNGNLHLMSQLLRKTTTAVDLGQKLWDTYNFQKEFEGLCEKALGNLKELSCAKSVDWGRSRVGDYTNQEAIREADNVLHYYERLLENSMQRRADEVAHLSLRLFKERLSQASQMNGNEDDTSEESDDETSTEEDGN